MPTLHIKNARIVEPGVRISTGGLLVRDGRIAGVGAQASGNIAAGEVVETVDAKGRLLTPGLIDVHTHGIMHHLYESGPDGLRAAVRELGRFGVTTVLPTIVPQVREGWIKSLGAIAAAIPDTRADACVPGLHIEGPFMAVGGAACPTLPGDVALLDEILDACAGRVSVMSISPDTPNIVPVIRRLRERGITVFITHTRANAEQTDAAIEAGARHATHFYNVFYPPQETEPGARPVGAVESVLADSRVTVDFIADGVHVHPTAIRAALAAKTWAGVILITDSNIGAGLPAGVYDTPWGFQVKVSASTGARHITKGTLAGSALTMDIGMQNLLKWLALPPEQTWAMATLNPARMLGLEQKGRLSPGADADLVLWDEDGGLSAAQTWLAGKTIYKK